MCKHVEKEETKVRAQVSQSESDEGINENSEGSHDYLG